MQHEFLCAVFQNKFLTIELRNGYNVCEHLFFIPILARRDAATFFERSIKAAFTGETALKPDFFYRKRGRFKEKFCRIDSDGN